ncbi:MAG: CRISPR system precrRNA processing endoribonuclease RAMP protein Cas6 [Chloroflexi bacterium]|nr:CRISPR system precrRNA processing endoribonuclease RAMP protein Cas6 [Chloroflexota bacterium]
MPHALLLPFEPRDLAGLPRDCTMALHRQVFEWFRMVDPALARSLHDKGHVPGGAAAEHGGGDGRFPLFTAAPADAHGGADYFVTVLADGDALFARLCRAIAAYPALEVDGRAVRLRTEPEVVAVRSYADLHAAAEPVECVRLRFATPTFFTSGGRTVLPPDPVRVFRGYAERWNAYAPAELHLANLADWEQAVRAGVVVRASELRPAARALRKGERTIRYEGAVGNVTYEITADDAFACWIDRLSDFAEFCGTGRMAAQGFGQTYRVDPFEAFPDEDDM